MNCLKLGGTGCKFDAWTFSSSKNYSSGGKYLQKHHMAINITKTSRVLALDISSFVVNTERFMYMYVKNNQRLLNTVSRLFTFEETVQSTRRNSVVARGGWSHVNAMIWLTRWIYKKLNSSFTYKLVKRTGIQIRVYGLYSFLFWF